MTHNRPSVIIASTNEAKDIARSIAAELVESCHVTTWMQFFDAGCYPVEALEEAALMADFAVVLFTGEDWTRSRGRMQRSPRDNLKFECGLFFGKLGRRRTFIVVDASANLKLPSDLSGITLAPINLGPSSSLQHEIRRVCVKIERLITKLGRRNADAACTVDLYYHEREFTRAQADAVRSALTERGVRCAVHEHASPAPDAIFIGSLIAASEARLVLSHVPYVVRYIFRPDYPDSEGGDADGRKIGIGYASDYNLGRRGERGTPSRITQSEFEQLRHGSMTNAELAMFLANIHLRGRARQTRRVAMPR